MRLVVLAAVLGVTSPALAAPGLIAVPPAEVDLGAAAPVGEATIATNSTELRAGMHWASLAWKPTRIDFGFGYAGSYRTLPATGPLERAIDGSLVEPTLKLHGGYLSISYALESHRHWRTWLGARVETFTGDYHDERLTVLGGAVRIGAELFSAGVGAASDHRVLAMAAGTWALGVYVEGTARTLPVELGPVSMGAGVTMRIPFLFAIGS